MAGTVARNFVAHGKAVGQPQCRSHETFIDGRLEGVVKTGFRGAEGSSDAHQSVLHDALTAVEIKVVQARDDLINEISKLQTQFKMFSDKCVDTPDHVPQLQQTTRVGQNVCPVDGELRTSNQSALSQQSPSVSSIYGDAGSYPSVCSTDSLVEVVCSVVADAIRKHCASSEFCKLPPRGSCNDVPSRLSLIPCKVVASKSSWTPPVLTKRASLLEENPRLVRSSKKEALSTSLDFIAISASFRDTAAPIDGHWSTRLTIMVGSSRYDILVAVLIVTHAMFLGLSVEVSAKTKNAEDHPKLFVIDQLYSLFFLLELLMRMFVSGFGFFRNRDAAWNCFDFIVVGLTTIQSAVDLVVTSHGQGHHFRVLGVLRAVRALRVARVFRTFKLVRPLRRLVSGIVGTLSSCFWALVLLFASIFIFSVTFTDAAVQALYGDGGGESGHDSDTYLYYGSIIRSVDTLFQSICGGVSWGQPLRALGGIKDTGAFFVIVFYIYIGFTYFAVLNVVTALFCQVAVENSLTDQDLVMETQMRECKYVRDKCRELFKELEQMERSELSPEGMFRLDELEMFLEKQDVQARFSILGIEPADAWNLFKLLDRDDGGLIDMEEFVSGCVRLRGDAKRIDVSLLMYNLEISLNRIDDAIAHVTQRLAC